MKRLHFVLLGIFVIGFMFLAFSKAEVTEFVPKEEIVTSKKKILNIPVEEGVYYGQASYYGKKWNGRATANMEIFDCTKLTSASPELPFNTKIKVTNLDNNKSVIVRVNDRGPFKIDKEGGVVRPLEPHPKRVLDLSRKSFRKIGDLDKGILNIKYEIVGL